LDTRSQAESRVKFANEMNSDALLWLETAGCMLARLVL
jgi:hypothetical protein